MGRLEEIAESGMFTVGREINREFLPFNETLTSDFFSEAINYGSISVSDAYEHFFSYSEDPEIWGLPRNQEWRALLPSWKGIISAMTLIDEKMKELGDVMIRSYVKSLDYFKDSYNPFLDDFIFCGPVSRNNGLVAEHLSFASKKKIKHNQIIKALGKMDYSLIKEFFFEYIEEVAQKGSYRGISNIVETKNHQLIINLLLRAEKKKTREKIVEKIGLTMGESGVDLLLPYFETEYLPHGKVYSAICNIGTENAIPIFIKGLSRGGKIEEGCSRALEKLMSPKSVNGLMEYVESNPKNPDVALEIIAKAGGEAGFDFLKRYVSDASHDVEYGISLLGETHDPRAIPIIKEFIPKFESTSLHALAECGEGAIPAIEEHIRNNNYDVEDYVYFALAEIASTKGLPILFEALERTEKRQFIFYAINQLADDEAVRTLKQMMVNYGETDLERAESIIRSYEEDDYAEEVPSPEPVPFKKKDKKFKKLARKIRRSREPGVRDLCKNLIEEYGEVAVPVLCDFIHRDDYPDNYFFFDDDREEFYELDYHSEILSAIIDLERFGSESAVPSLVKFLLRTREHDDYVIHAIDTLDSKLAIEGLTEYMLRHYDDKDLKVFKILCKLDSLQTIKVGEKYLRTVETDCASEIVACMSRLPDSTPAIKPLLRDAFRGNVVQDYDRHDFRGKSVQIKFIHTMHRAIKPRGYNARY